MSVHAETVRLLIFPKALVIVAIGVNQATVSIDSVMDEVAFVKTSIRPYDNARPVSIIFKPEALVTLT